MSRSKPRGRAGLVGVLEAQDEGPADVAGVEEVEERRAGGPDVERAGRAGRDANARRRTCGDCSALAAARVPGRRAAGPASAPANPSGTWWKSAGSASPRRTWTSAAGRRPSVARPIGPSSVTASSDCGAGQDRDVGAGRQAPRLQVREERRVLLGRLGDPVDGRPLAGLQARRAGPRAGGARRRRGRSGCRAGTSPGWPRSSSRRASTRGEIAPWRRAASTSDSAQPRPTTGREEPLQERVAPEDGVGRGPAGRREEQLAPLPLGDEAVGPEAPDHLAGGLRRDADLAGDVGGRDAAAVAGGDAQREEVLLGGAGEVGRGAAGHAVILPRAARPGSRPTSRAARDTRRPGPTRPASAGEPGDAGQHDRGRGAGPPGTNAAAERGRPPRRSGSRRRRPRGRRRSRPMPRRGQEGEHRHAQGLERERGHEAARQPRERPPARRRRPEPAGSREERRVERRRARVLDGQWARRRGPGGRGRAAAGRAVRRRRAGDGGRRCPRRGRRGRGRRRGDARRRAGGRVGGTRVARALRRPRCARAPRRPLAVRRAARAWYSGPCLRGSAYSFGLIVQ